MYLIQFWQGDLNDCESCTDIQPGLLSTATTLQNNVSAELTTGLKKKHIRFNVGRFTNAEVSEHDE